MKNKDFRTTLKPVSLIPLIFEGYTLAEDGSETHFTITDTEAEGFELRKRGGELIGSFDNLRVALQEAWALWYVQPRFDRITNDSLL